MPDYNGAAVVRAGLVREKEGRRYDYFRGRVMFPIFTSPTRLAGFGGRTLGDDEPKYLNSPESPLFAKGRTLFGLPQAADFARRRNRLIVCEGIHGRGDAFASGVRGVGCDDGNGGDGDANGKGGAGGG